MPFVSFFSKKRLLKKKLLRIKNGFHLKFKYFLFKTKKPNIKVHIALKQNGYFLPPFFGTVCPSISRKAVYFLSDESSGRNVPTCNKYTLPPSRLTITAVFLKYTSKACVDACSYSTTKNSRKKCDHPVSSGTLLAENGQKVLRKKTGLTLPPFWGAVVWLKSKWLVIATLKQLTKSRDPFYY